MQLPLKNVIEPVVFDQPEQLIGDVNKFLDQGEAQLLSAGETSDGLAFDHVTRFSDAVVPLFSRQDEGHLFPKEKKHKLLFVTKSANVKQLLRIKEHKNVIVSFSLNAPEIARRYEHGAAHPHARLRAAARCQRAGYEIRIRIDPIMPVKGWKALYQPLVDRIASTLDTQGLRFTLGTIRHNIGLRECTKARGRDETVYDPANSQEGADTRYRLPFALRREVYGWFKEKLPADASVALCKETEELWRDLGLDPANPKCNCAL
ncbi:MAG: hypothetical protein L3K26_17405 [Candidatus Hydrogenedentes bacterium]|nr:hypothetical protein [Candidatus Hydrogenedentota bacterium]